MLAYILAIAIALPSLSLYLSAFFLPELHRQDDFLWSGVGLFYALVLWLCAPLLTGGILLGQAAAVTLIVSFGWQTVRLRRALTRPEDQTDLTGFSVLNWLKARFGGKIQPQPIPPSVPVEETPSEITETVTESLTEELLTQEETPQEPIEEIVDAIAPSLVEEIVEEVAEETPPPPPTEEQAETPIIAETQPETQPKPKKGFSLKSLFSFGKSKSQPQPESITTALDNVQLDTENDDWEETDTSSQVAEKAIEAVVEEEIATEEKALDDNFSSGEVIIEKTSQESESLSVENSLSSLVEEEKETPIEQYKLEEFEVFVAENDDETVIDKYQPVIAESSSDKTLEEIFEESAEKKSKVSEGSDDSDEETISNK